MDSRVRTRRRRRGGAAAEAPPPPRLHPVAEGERSVDVHNVRRVYPGHCSEGGGPRLTFRRPPSLPRPRSLLFDPQAALKSNRETGRRMLLGRLTDVDPGAAEHSIPTPHPPRWKEGRAVPLSSFARLRPPRALK